MITFFHGSHTSHVCACWPKILEGDRGGFLVALVFALWCGNHLCLHIFCDGTESANDARVWKSFGRSHLGFMWRSLRDRKHEPSPGLLFSWHSSLEQIKALGAEGVLFFPQKVPHSHIVLLAPYWTQHENLPVGLRDLMVLFSSACFESDFTYFTNVVLTTFEF